MASDRWAYWMSSAASRSAIVRATAQDLIVGSGRQTQLVDTRLEQVQAVLGRGGNAGEFGGGAMWAFEREFVPLKAGLLALAGGDHRVRTSRGLPVPACCPASSLNGTAGTSMWMSMRSNKGPLIFAHVFLDLDGRAVAIATRVGAKTAGAGV